MAGDDVAAVVGFAPGGFDAESAVRSAVGERADGLRIVDHEASDSHEVASALTHLVVERSERSAPLLAQLETLADPPAVLYVDEDPERAARAMTGAADVFLHADRLDQLDRLDRRLHPLLQGRREPNGEDLGSIDGSIDAAAYRTLMETFDDHVYVLNRYGEFARVNETKARFHDATPATLHGQTDFDVFPPTVAVDVYADTMAVMEREAAIDNQREWVEGADGTLIHVTASKKPIRADGVVIGGIGISREITQLTRHRMLVAKLKEVIEHLYGMYVHNFRNRSQRAFAVGPSLERALETARTASDRLADVEPGSGDLSANGGEPLAAVQDALEEAAEHLETARQDEREGTETLRTLVGDFSDLIAVVNATGEVGTYDVRAIARDTFDRSVSGESVTVETDGFRLRLIFHQLARELDDRGSVDLAATARGFELSVPGDLSIPAVTNELKDRDLTRGSMSLFKLRLLVETLGWDVDTEPVTDGHTPLTFDVAAWKQAAGAPDV